MKITKYRLGLAGVFILAISVRILFVREWLSSIYSTTPFLDAMAYHQWAERIAGGEWFGKSVFYQNPLYPYVVGGLYKLFGPNPATVSIFQVVVGGFTCVFIAHAGKRFFNERAGLAAGVLAALHHTAIYFTGPLLKETLGLFFLALFLLFFASARSGRAGVALGLAALVRSNVLVLPVTLLPWARRNGRQFALLSLGLIFTLLPSLAHNYRAAWDLVLINSAGGFNFYVGNSPSGLLLEYPPGVSTDPAFEERDAKELAERDAGRPLKPSEVSSYWFNKGLDFIFSQPRAAILHFLNKALIFWNGREIGDNYDLEFYESQFPGVLNYMPVGFVLIAVLAALGWGLARGSTHASAANLLTALALIYFLSVIIFYVNDRYRLPVVVFLLPLAGLALERIFYGTWSRGEALRAALICLPFIIVGLYPMGTKQDRVLAFNFGLLAGLYSDAGADSEAIKAYQQSLAANPGLTGAFAHIKASTSFERLGRLKEAEEALAQSVKVHGDGMSLFNYGRFKYEHGDLIEAENLYKRANEVAPYLYQPYLGLSLVYFKMGDKARACAAGQAGLRLRPKDENLLKVAELCR